MKRWIRRIGDKIYISENESGMNGFYMTPAQAAIVGLPTKIADRYVEIDIDARRAKPPADEPQRNYLAELASHLRLWIAGNRPFAGGVELPTWKVWVAAVEEASLDLKRLISDRNWLRAERDRIKMDRENLKAELAALRASVNAKYWDGIREDNLKLQAELAQARELGKIDADNHARFDKQLKNELEIAGRAHIEEIKGLVQEQDRVKQELAQARERNANLVTQELASGDGAELAKARERIDWLENARGLAISARDEALRQLAAREKTSYPFDREFLGQIVREEWIAWAKQQSNPNPSWLVYDLAGSFREVDRRIGERVANVACTVLKQELTEAKKDILRQREIFDNEQAETSDIIGKLERELAQARVENESHRVFLNEASAERDRLKAKLAAAPRPKVTGDDLMVLKSLAYIDREKPHVRRAWSRAIAFIESFGAKFKERSVETEQQKPHWLTEAVTCLRNHQGRAESAGSARQLGCMADAVEQCAKANAELARENDRLKAELAEARRCDVTADQLRILRGITQENRDSMPIEMNDAEIEAVTAAVAFITNFAGGADAKLTLHSLQEQQKPWVKHNFGERPTVWPLLGLVEELGELCHAVLKDWQGIRTNEDHTAAAKDAIGDLVIFLSDYCSSRCFDLQQIVEDTWAKVQKRDWKADPKNGADAKIGSVGYHDVDEFYREEDAAQRPTGLATGGHSNGFCTWSEPEPAAAESEIKP